MKITVKAADGPALKRRLEARAERINEIMHNFQSFWASVGAYMQRQTITERFDKEQSPDGKRWATLAPATVMRRILKHRSMTYRILQDTGELRRSIAYEATKNGVRIGSKLKYARTHQFGRDNIPARPFLGVTPEELEHIKKMLRTAIKRKSKQVGKQIRFD